MNFQYLKSTTLLLVLVSILTSSISSFAFSGSVEKPFADQSESPSPTNIETNKPKISNKPSIDYIADQINEDTTLDNTLLIKVKDGEDVIDVKNKLKETISDRYDIKKDRIMDYDATDDDVVALQFDNADKLKEGYKVAAKDSRIEIAQPNYKYKKQYTPNDTEFNASWYLKDQVSGVSAQSGWDAVGTKAGVTCGDASAQAKRCGGENAVKIAVIDSGVNLNIADFAGAPVDVANSMRFFNSLTGGPNNGPGGPCPVNQTYIPANGLTPGWQFCQVVGSQFDEDGHGTGVAATIMSQDNAVGNIGLAHNTTLLPIALHNDTFNTFFISEAIKYAQQKGAKVINMSLGTPYYDSFLENSINAASAAGVTVVASSGNCAVFSVASCDWDGSGTQNKPEEANNTPMYPAAFANVIAVGASNYATTTAGITRSCYSNYGAYVDIVVPIGDTGTACRPTGGPSQSSVRVPCGFVRSGCATADTFAGAVGTSYASPLVAAGIALLLSTDNTLTSTQVRDILLGSATDIGVAGRDDQFGNGLMNIANTMQLVSANYVPTHYFPWYGTNGNNHSWTLVGNPSTTTSIKIKLELAGTNYLRYATLVPGQSIFHEVGGLLGGPVKVSSENGGAIYATQRTHMEINGNYSFNEYPGIEPNSFSNTYYFPWYGTNGNNHSWTLVGNPSTTTNANVTIKFNGNTIRTATIAPGASIFHETGGLLGGPVVVTSDTPIYATQRTHMEINGNYSFNEYAGISPTSFSNKFYYPWYGSNGKNHSWTLVGNPSTTTNANITIKFNGNTIRTATIAPGASIFHETGGLLGGPVVVDSDIPIYSTQRTHMEINGFYSFNEYVGISPVSFSNTYYFPWYGTNGNNHSWTLVGNPSTTTNANVSIKFNGNTIRTATIAPGASIFHETGGLLGGPVVVTSDAPIYATQRTHMEINGNYSFNEYLGIKP
jgi:hypothetical protein